jgi:hypothetical protein
MKTMRLISAGSVLAWLLAVTLPAHAITVTPPGPFSAQGPFVLTKAGIRVVCETVLTGTISANGEMTITRASMSGNSLCKAIAPVISPRSGWTGRIESAQSLALDNVAVNVGIPISGGLCGPANIKAAISVNPASEETLFSFSNQVLTGGCSMSGTLTTTPYLSVTD